MISTFFILFNSNMTGAWFVYVDITRLKIFNHIRSILTNNSVKYKSMYFRPFSMTVTENSVLVFQKKAGPRPHSCSCVRKTVFEKKK